MSWSGKRVVLTGTFDAMKLSEAAAKLEKLGVVVRDIVSKQTDIVFAGAKAQALGIRIADEAALLRMLAGEELVELEIDTGETRSLGALPSPSRFVATADAIILQHGNSLRVLASQRGGFAVEHEFDAGRTMDGDLCTACGGRVGCSSRRGTGPAGTSCRTFTHRSPSPFGGLRPLTRPARFPAPAPLPPQRKQGHAA